MISSPKYYGTKLGEIVKAISIESKHSWRDIQKTTGFTEKELNFYLAQLFTDGVITKERGNYYINPSLQAEWQTYHLKTTSPPAETIITSENVKRNEISHGLNITRIVFIILLVLSLGLNLVNFSTISRLETQITEQNTTIQEYESTVAAQQSEVALLNYQIQYLKEQNKQLASYVTDLELQLSNSYSHSSSSSSNTTDDNSDYSSTSTRTVYIDRIATCIRIIDGDTFELSSGIRVRLADVDAPEYYESGYSRSTDALSSWILGKQVYLDVDDLYITDSYGRYVCVVYVAYGSGYTNVNHALLIEGHVTLSNYPNEFDPTVWGTPGNINISEAVPDSSSSSSSSTSSSDSYDGSFWASKNSNIYHKPSCYWAQQISPSNLIIFSSRSAAEAAGYRACQVCKP